MAQVRLDKILASCTGGTRSETKKLLRKGVVTVNGTVEKSPERKVDAEKDVICLEGRPLSCDPFVCLMFHKPAGCVTATEDRHQKTVLDYIDHPRKRELFPVGRLDADTEGLLLLMNDGDLAHRMLSPKRHVPKTYYARVAGEVMQEDVEAFRQGVDIGEKALTLPAALHVLSVREAGQEELSAELRVLSVRKAGKEELSAELRVREAGQNRFPATLRASGTDGAAQDSSTGVETQHGRISEVTLTICEGKFHQVKRMFEARGKRVLYLKRTEMAGLALDPGLAPGEWRELTKEERERLQKSC